MLRRYGRQSTFTGSSGISVAHLVVLLAGCAVTDSPSGSCASRDPVETIASIFAEAIPGNPHATPFRDRDVVTANATAIAWRAVDAPGEPVHRLRYADIDAIAYHVEAELPSRPEAIFIYLRAGDNAAEDAGAVRVLFESTGLARPYLVLHRRPPGSHRRLREALAALGFYPGVF